MAFWARIFLMVMLCLCQDLFSWAQSPPPETPQVVVDADNLFVDETEDVIIAEGNVEAMYEGRIMRADRLVYNNSTDTVRASGNVIIIDPDGAQRFASEIETDSTLSDGYAIGFSTRLANGGTAIAETAVRTKDGFNALDKIVFSSCEICEEDDNPTWALRARRAVLDQSTEMMSYRDAVLEIAGVPVFYLPWFAHPDPGSGRRSGFLTPDFGASSKLGLFYQQPYYWAASPYQDLTISSLISANVNPLLEFDYRKRFWSGDIRANFSFTYEQDFDSDGEKFGEREWRGHLFAQGAFNITPNWQWGFGIKQVSDDLYTRRYDIDGVNDPQGLYQGQPLRLISQIYTVGQDRNWYADTTLLSLTGLRDGDQDAKLPRALPVAYAERLIDMKDYGLLGLNASSAILDRRDGIDSYRVSLGADWQTSLIVPGGLLFNPFAETRFDQYKLQDLDPNTYNSASLDFGRGIAAGGARLSYPLYRPGRSVDILIEPEAMAAYATPGFNTDQLPVEDSILFEFDESSLFEANTVSGYDLYEGGAKAALGLSARARWKNGVELNVLGGRRWRDQTETRFEASTNLDGTTSDWVTGASLTFGRPLTLETRLRLDDDDWSVNRVDARLKTDWWRLKGQVRYYKLSGDITSSGAEDEGVDIDGEFQLSDHYYFIYGRERDISGRPDNRGGNKAARDLRHTFGFAYEDDCSRFQVAFERSEALDRTLGPNDSILFRFALKSLGDFGSDNVD